MPISSLRSRRSVFIWRFMTLKSPTEEYETSVIARPFAPARAVLPMR